MVELREAMVKIDDRLERIEGTIGALIARCEPLLVEAARRLEGSLRWRRNGG